MGRMTEQAFHGIKTRSELDGYAESGNATIYKLINHVEAIELELKVSKEDEVEAVRKCGQAMKDIDRLTENLAQLKRELDESREAKKVPLPWKVANAIDSLMQGRTINSHEEIGWTIFNIIKLPHEHLNKDARFLKSHFSCEWYKLCAALVIGYTIEEPPSTEDKIEAKLESLLNDTKVGSVVPVRELAVLLTLAIREVLAEDRHEESAI
ncbi:MAG: hypothetical protein ACQEXQ_16110 [Bacillota bacterium]